MLNNNLEKYDETPEENNTVKLISFLFYSKTSVKNENY